jgi:outer membrane protein
MRSIDWRELPRAGLLALGLAAWVVAAPPAVSAQAQTNPRAPEAPAAQPAQPAAPVAGLAQADQPAPADGPAQADQPAQAAAEPAQPRPLTVEQAVQMALKSNPAVDSALWDWRSASEQAAVASLRRLPSLSLSAGYDRLSELPAVVFAGSIMGTPFQLTLPASGGNSMAVGAHLQLPLFAGFRLTEAARAAELLAASKEAALEMVKRALTFEVRRAYWQAKLADASVEMLRKNLTVAGEYRDEVHDQVEQGVATLSDQLSADQQYDQAEMALSDAVSMRGQASLLLSSLLGQADVGAEITARTVGPGGLTAPPPYQLLSEPDAQQLPQNAPTMDTAQVVSEALMDRPETRAANAAVEAARHARLAARGGLYPTLALVGDYLYANPNPRVFPPSGDFTGTWSVGVHLSFDLGGLPANLAQARSAEDDMRKAQAQARKQQDAVALDVRTTILSLERARRDLEMTRGTVTQAQERLRVARQKYDNGVARHLDVLEAELALIKARFAVTNKQVELQVAAADFARAAALEQTD